MLFEENIELIKRFANEIVDDYEETFTMKIMEKKEVQQYLVDMIEMDFKLPLKKLFLLQTIIWGIKEEKYRKALKGVINHNYLIYSEHKKRDYMVLDVCLNNFHRDYMVSAYLFCLSNSGHYSIKHEVFDVYEYNINTSIHAKLGRDSTNAFNEWDKYSHWAISDLLEEFSSYYDAVEDCFRYKNRFAY